MDSRKRFEKAYKYTLLGCDDDEETLLWDNWVARTITREHIPYITTMGNLGNGTQEVRDGSTPLICGPVFWKPTTIYEVKIPHKIYDKLRTVTLGKKVNKATKMRMDRLMVFLEWMTRKHETYSAKHHRQRKGIPVNKDKWMHIAGSNEYREYLKDLLKLKGIVMPWTSFNGTESYSYNRGVMNFSKAYFIPEKMRDGDKVTYRLSFPIDYTPEPTEQQEWLLESYKYISVPTERQVRWESRYQFGNLTKTGKELLPLWLCCELEGYHPDNSYEKVLPIEVHLDNYERFLTNGVVEPVYGEYGRMVEPIANLPGWIRDEMLLIDGEPAAKCDYQALHHNLWYPIVKNIPEIPAEEKRWWRNNATGDAHTSLGVKLAEMEGVKYKPEHRDTIKIESLSHYNTTKYMMQYKKELVDGERDETRMGRLLHKHVPHIWNFIKGTKRGPNGHCNTSVILTRTESLLIQMCIIGLKEVGIHCIYVHDCLMVAHSNKEEAASIMWEIAKELDIWSRVD